MNRVTLSRIQTAISITRKAWTKESHSEEDEAMRVTKTHPPIAADLLLPGQLFVSENPSGFRPNILHYTSQVYYHSDTPPTRE